MKFIDELRKCDPGSIVRAPTQYEEENRKWVGAPISQLLREWDMLIKERDSHKARADMLENTLRTSVR